MGLAASQARLLTITARKADCEFQSMRYSHQKIALSRNMTDISNEYQSSLEKTKLVYDFYGNGDTSLALTYGMMMTPSELNGHMPILTTDSAGKVVLNASYAAAAKAAGIPREGFGCLPSTTIRNKFLDALAGAGLITEVQANAYKAVTYAQEMGLGTTDLVTSTVEKMTLADLLDYYSSNPDQVLFDHPAGSMKTEAQNIANSHYSGGINHFDFIAKAGDNDNDVNGTLSIADIVKGDYQILCGTGDRKDGGKRTSAMNAIGDLSIWEWMFSEMARMLGVTGNAEVAGAIAYAEAMCQSLISHEDGVALYVDSRAKTGNITEDLDQPSSGGNFSDGFWGGAFGKNAKIPNTDFIGYCVVRNTNWWGGEDGIAINVSNIAKAYLTYFAQYMEGGERTSEYKVSDIDGNRTVFEEQGTHFITLEDENFFFDVVVDQGINTDNALNSGFYDALFNQICLKGWVENPNVDDRDYLQETLQSGVLFISTCNDDGNYYQGNYSTNTFIKEVADEEAIARAEAKYNVEKQKINSKEEALDMKMKNLDTEISSLTTEYDTIKSVISKNIEKSFKRYDA